MIYGVGNEFTDFSANLDQQRLIGGTVVAVDFADVFAVGDFAGEGFRVVADVGGERVDRTDQAGVVHEGVAGGVVDTETEGMGAQLDALAFPPYIGTAVGGDAEIVKILAGKITLSPTRLDSRLCQYDRRIDPERFPRLLGKGKERGKKFALLHFFWLKGDLIYSSPGRSSSPPPPDDSLEASFLGT